MMESDEEEVEEGEEGTEDSWQSYKSTDPEGLHSAPPARVSN